MQSIVLRKFHAIALITAVAACGGVEDGDASASAEGWASEDSSAAEMAEASGPQEADLSGPAPDTSFSQPNPAYIPTPTGPCPTFQEGTLTFRPAGIPARNVRIWMSSAATTSDGPLIFYWHGTGSQPSEAATGIGTTQLNAIKAQGGIVAAPERDPSSGTFPWFYVTSTSRDDDFRVADEVLACAIQKVGVDVSRIHSMGMSAGGLNTTQMSYRRSGYIASVATYSGGRMNSIPTQDPSNKFASMIFHGGSSDVVVISFQTASQNYYNDLKSKSQFATICNHNNGHSIPLDARAAVWQFFQAHPFGTVPSPYAGGLPSSMPSYCTL